MTLADPPPDLAQRFDRLIKGLFVAIGNYTSEHRDIWPFTNQIIKLLCRRRTRFNALFARFRAGTLPAPRPSRPRATRPASSQPASSQPASSQLVTAGPAAATPLPPVQSGGGGMTPLPVLPMPRRRGWLTGMMGWQVAAYANEGLLKVFLLHPEIAEFLAAAPQAGRLLRPLWHMVSTEPLPELLRLPRRPRVRRARPKRAPQVSRAAPGWPGAGSLYRERPHVAPQSTPRGAFRSASQSQSRFKSGRIFRP